MLMNLEEKIPDIFYIFVNQYNPITVHNLNFTKCFTSAAYAYCGSSDDFIKKYLNGTATYLPYKLNEMDLKFLSPYFLSAINDYKIEYDAENYRAQNFPLYPSRFSAIYAFGDYETCELVSQKYNWDISTVKKFKLDKDLLTRVVKVNMEIISLSRLAYKISMVNNETINTIWNNYWSGNGNFQIELPSTNMHHKIYQANDFFEYLIEGKIILQE